MSASDTGKATSGEGHIFVTYPDAFTCVAEKRCGTGDRHLFHWPDMEETEKKVAWYGKFLATLESSGLHGINVLMASSSNKFKFVWGIVLFMFFMLALLHTYATFRNASDSPTHYKTHHHVTSLEMVPNLTFCPWNGLFLDSATLIRNFQDSERDNPTTKTSIIDIEEVLALIKALPDVGYLYGALMEKIGATGEESYNVSKGLEGLGVKFNGSIALAVETLIEFYVFKPEEFFSVPGVKSSKCPKMPQCCQALDHFFNYAYGWCYIYQSWCFEKENYKDRFLHIRIENISEWDRIAMHLSKEPFLGNEYVLFGGSEDDIYIDVTFVSDIPQPGKCLKNHDANLELFQEYTQIACKLENLTLPLSDNYPCYWAVFRLMNPTYSDRLNRNICNLSDMTPWVANHIHPTKSTPIQDARRSSLYECLPLCERWEYTMTYRHSRDVSKVTNDTTITLRFMNPSFSILTEVPTLSWTDYLGMVGGLWGLYLGTSAITFIHIIGVLIYSIIGKLKALIFEERCNKYVD